jgi:ABC-type nitrate/sulfonate/bicarbonate transport system substrate-binding protein
LTTIRQTVFVMPTALGVAERAGLMGDLEVTTTFTQSSRDQESLLASGGADLAITAMDNIVAWNERGGDFSVLGQIERTTPLTLFARVPISHIRDLAAARVAVDASDSGFAIPLRALLQRNEVTIPNEAWLPLGGVRQRFEALLAGNCDATLLGPPFDVFAEKSGLIPLVEIQKIWPDFPGQGIVAARETIKAKRTALLRYLSVMQAGLDWAFANPEKVLEQLLNASIPQSAAWSILRSGPTDLVPRRTGIELLINTRVELGLMEPSVLSYDMLVDLSLVHEAQSPKQDQIDQSCE